MGLDEGARPKEKRLDESVEVVGSGSGPWPSADARDSRRDRQERTWWLSCRSFEFTAEAAAEILAPQPQLPNQPEVVKALADLWVQYFLLARAAAEDTTLGDLDVSLTGRPTGGRGAGRGALRDQVIQVDTAISDEELQARYEQELPGGTGQGPAHPPPVPFRSDATAQVDSVRALAASLRSRILDGEIFGDLAREYSQDTGTAANGGDLGSFGQGEMVPAFEAAAFALEEGEISDVVETTFGLHLIRWTSGSFRPWRRGGTSSGPRSRPVVMEAESTYVANLVEECRPGTRIRRPSRRFGKLRPILTWI